MMLHGHREAADSPCVNKLAVHLPEYNLTLAGINYFAPPATCRQLRILKDEYRTVRSNQASVGKSAGLFLND